MRAKHWSHYFSLIGILVATLIGFIAFSYDKNFELALITACSISYFVWGIIHHIIHKDLKIEIIFEYLIIALIGFVVGISVIFRA